MKSIPFKLLAKYALSAWVVTSITASVSAQNWKHLQDPKDWEQKGGSAEYQWSNNLVEGTTVANTPNSFLTTKTHYSDFILEFMVWVDPAINSGVQIRSHSKKDYKDGRVHGYQVELDPSPRAYSAGIYDEGRRMWMYPLSRNPKARKAFRNGEWNQVRVEAVGDNISTWVNGIQCANLTDELTASGFIGLQVHSVKAELAGKKVKWKDIRILTDDLDEYRWPQDPQVPEISYLVNRLSESEQRRGWRLLWDGKTGQGWRSARESEFPQQGWLMDDGVLTVVATDGGESTGPGDIITREQFADFELELEFKLTKGANSGIKYFVDPGLNQSVGSAIGCEFQLLDDQQHPDAKQGVAGNRTVAALYDLIAPENLSVPGRGKQFKGLDQWNHARIVSKDGVVSHWLNHEKTIEYDRFSQMFRALVAYSKYKKWNDFGQWDQGHILLQDHGDTVHFRSIKIREL